MKAIANHSIGSRSEGVPVPGERAVGDPREEHPKVFQEINLTYEFKGEGLDPEWCSECARKSLTKYSPTAAILKAVVPLYFTVVVND